MSIAVSIFRITPISFLLFYLLTPLFINNVKSIVIGVLKDDFIFWLFSSNMKTKSMKYEIDKTFKIIRIHLQSLVMKLEINF